VQPAPSFSLRQALASACDTYGFDAVANALNCEKRSIYRWKCTGNIPAVWQEKIRVALEGLDCTWPNQLRRLNFQYSLIKDECERHRIINMMAMTIANWAAALGFDFVVTAQTRPWHPKRFSIWSARLPEVELKLHPTRYCVTLHATDRTGLRRIELEPCVVSAYFAELKQQEQSSGPQADTSFEVYDARIPQNHGASKT
jgi:hypothetical protein